MAGLCRPHAGGFAGGYAGRDALRQQLSRVHLRGAFFPGLPARFSCPGRLAAGSGMKWRLCNGLEMEERQSELH